MRKYAIITGGSRGIGRAICEKLAQDTDYHLLITYQSNEVAALETLNHIKKLGSDGEIIRFDVSDHQSTTEALTQWQHDNKDAVVEVIVNNAGINRDGLFMWMPQEDWSKVISTTLDGFYNVTNFFIQKMLRHRYGRIINISSVSGVKGTAGQTNYSAAKGAIIAAGFIRTDMTSSLNEEDLVKLIPVGRFGEAEEVADLVSFLVSKKASYITGEVININGGVYS